MIDHRDLAENELRSLLKAGSIAFAGNRNLKIYGLLTCSSGKRMKKENRVFFPNEIEAQRAGYRPCGNCMRKRLKEDLYISWDDKSPHHLANGQIDF
jgi:methylphosphotriester-DNA--protein-cysteine methyltransferase